MAELFSDVRYAVRVLARNPGFAAVAILTLALGIGGNTAIFTIFDGVLLRPLPFREPQRLAAINETIPKFAYLAPTFPVAADHFLKWRKQAHSFDQIALSQEIEMNLTSNGEPVRVSAGRVSAALFPLLGIQAKLGRTFRQEEDKLGNDRVVVLSDRLWSSRFQRDPAIVGRKIILDGNPYEVIGVLPAGVQLPKTSQVQSLAVPGDYAQLWKPLGLRVDEIQALGDFDFGCIARLAPGVSFERANAELNAIQDGIGRTLPEKIALLANVVPLQRQITGGTRASLVLLLAAVGAVLLIVCVNLANLLLARAAARRRELAVRLAIGAGAGRILRQMLTESLLLASLGGALGVAVAAWTLRVMLAGAPVDLPRIGEVHLDWRVLSFALAVTVLSGLLFGALPAWRATRTDPQTALQAGGRSTMGRHGGRVRRALIAVEVALSAACLVTGGLLLHSFSRVMQVDKGFRTERTLTVTLSLPWTRYRDRQHQSQFIRPLLDRVAALPGVTDVGTSNVLPLSGEGNNNVVMPEGANWPIVERPLADQRSVNPGFFRTMGIPLLSGRMFQDSDRERLVAVISAALARRLWPGENALGKKIVNGDDTDHPIEVVGMVGDVRGVSLTKTPNPTMYRPYWQRFQSNVGLVVRTGSAPAALAGAIRHEIRRLDPEMPVPAFQTLDQLVDESVAQRRFQLELVLLFAVAALALAAVGVYGVVAQLVSQRTNEIGIRMALGAHAGDVRRMVLLEGLGPVAAGLAAGFAAALLAGRLVSGLLFGVRATDPLTFGAVAAVLLAAALAACLIPARRATRIDPLEALRYE
ncbi:MAG: ABC transporter permease [Bryobacteraceae bacterium]